MIERNQASAAELTDVAGDAVNPEMSSRVRVSVLPWPSFDAPTVEPAPARVVHLVEERSLGDRFEDAAFVASAIGDDALGPSMSERAILEQFVRCARRVVGAQFAAMGTPADPKLPMDPWIYDGVELESSLACSSALCPASVVDYVARSGATVRIRDIRVHPAFQDILSRSPEITSFLALPARAYGATAGTLVVANKIGANEFSADDERVLRFLTTQMYATLRDWRMRQKARRAAESRDRILAMVAHDLRTPLQAMTLRIGYLESEVPLEQRPQFASLQRATRRMKVIIEDLLNAAALDRGSLAMTLTMENVASIVREAVEAIGPLARHRTIDIAVTCADPLASVLCDRDRVLQVLEHLLDNAIKFTKAGGRVTLAVERFDASVRFSVVDDGPGISSDDVPYVFERHWKGTPTKNGTGLGLYIAKSIVEAHGGSIGVETELGLGSTFSFTLATERGTS